MPPVSPRRDPMASLASFFCVMMAPPVDPPSGSGSTFCVLFYGLDGAARVFSRDPYYSSDPMAPLVSFPCTLMAPLVFPLLDLAMSLVSPAQYLAAPFNINSCLLVVSAAAEAPAHVLRALRRLPPDSSSLGFTSRSSPPTPFLPVLSGPSIHCTPLFPFNCKRAWQTTRCLFAMSIVASFVFCVFSSLGFASILRTITKSRVFSTAASAVPCLGLRLTSVQGPHWSVPYILVVSVVCATNPTLYLDSRSVPQLLRETVPCWGRS